MSLKPSNEDLSASCSLNVSDSMDVEQSTKHNDKSQSNEASDMQLEDEQTEIQDLRAGKATRRKMKKDDSGIYVEKISDEMCDESENEIVENTVESHKTSGQNSPDSGNPDSSYSIGTVETKNEADSVKDFSHKNKKSTLSTAKDSKNDDSDEDFLSTKSDEPVKLSSDDDDDYDPTPKTERPKHKWFLCKEVINRQYGVPNRYSNDWFRYNSYSSLHMIERLELMYKMKKHEGCVNSLHFNTTGTKLVSGSDDLSIVIWDWAINEPVLLYDSGHRSNVFQAKFMPLSGDCHLVSCARDGQVRLAELSSTGVCKGTRKLAQHQGAVHKLALILDTPHTFLTCGEDGVVHEVDLRGNKPEKIVTCRDDQIIPLYTIFVNPNNPYEFAVGGRDHFIRIYDKRFIENDNGTVKKFCPHHLVNSDIRANVTCLVYNYNGTEILASYNDEDIYTFNSQHSDGAEYTHRYRGHRNNQTIKGVNYFGSKSEYIISGSDCGYIFFWEHDSEHIVHCTYGDEGGVVNCLEPHPTSPFLATSGLDDDIKIWVPSCEHSPDLSSIRARTCNNVKEREEDRKHDEPDTIDGQMLWFLLKHLQRSARRRAQMEGQERGESSSESSDTEDEDADNSNAIQCSQS
ncbi:DDB1- and CUL4-associated factor 8-like [Centruroides sculpturatus]|uniref:DDB1- and CUL4-associated factor 8-like n=1 Tax=Centruroides sculpturatus TaxID=218467 RepID=UPI000C6E5201|nr:DDB1- and CUL4-associated factor 8-like [Centruroides sculpturatus]